MGCLPRTAIPNAFVSFLYKAYEEILFTLLPLFTSRNLLCLSAF
ncbi:Uncharacterised protein [Segatella copri]|nr:Uncharacterised protein [Segatella copri]